MYIPSTNCSVSVAAPKEGLIVALLLVLTIIFLGTQLLDFELVPCLLHLKPHSNEFQQCDLICSTMWPHLLRYPFIGVIGKAWYVIPCPNCVFLPRSCPFLFLHLSCSFSTILSFPWQWVSPSLGMHFGILAQCTYISVTLLFLYCWVGWLIYTSIPYPRFSLDSFSLIIHIALNFYKLHK